MHISFYKKFFIIPLFISCADPDEEGEKYNGEEWVDDRDKDDLENSGDEVNVENNFTKEEILEMIKNLDASEM